MPFGHKDFSETPAAKGTTIFYYGIEAVSFNNCNTRTLGFPEKRVNRSARLCRPDPFGGVVPSANITAGGGDRGPGKKRVFGESW